MTGAWATSDRKARLPRDWAQRVAATRARASGQCEAIAEPRYRRRTKDAEPRCPEAGRDCDHITAGDNHALENLQWLCAAHHRSKTAAEAAAALRARAALARHPREKHPGLL